MVDKKKPKTKAKKKPFVGMPTRAQIVEFIAQSQQPAGKREIARAFKLRGAEKIALKALLKDMTDEGLIDMAPGRAFHKMGGLPKVTVLKIVEIDGNQPVAVPEHWEADNSPLPKLRVMERGRRGALGIGDRILARTEERGNGHVAHVMKKLAPAADALLGVVEKGERGRLWLRSIDKKIRKDVAISDLGDAEIGNLVMAEKSGRPPHLKAKVTEVLGDPFAPKSFSLIAIHKYGIPDQFSEGLLEEAEIAAKLRIDDGTREDLRDLPIIAIDPADARDYDDAIWAAPDTDSANVGGFNAIVAIADVSFYVRPGSKLDKEARKRGNSTYFPDRVVPMLPEALSADMCSLRAGEDRAALACHLKIDRNGKVTSWRFTRAIVRISANIPYEKAQAAIDGAIEHPLKVDALEPLWACWKLLAQARDKREPLELDLPERRVVLDDKGRISSIAERDRLDAHRLVEEYMISANVAAAKALESKKAPVVYRVHEVPSREKLVALKEYLKTFEQEFALGQVVKPSIFNNLIKRLTDEEIKPQIMLQILRSQTQAFYSPQNMGHFGLSLGSYGHFTSPIRRYADLLIHRSLVGAYKLETAKPHDESIIAKTALTDGEAHDLEVIAESISQTERRSMMAERDTVDRYVAAYLSEKVGEILPTRITGVQNFGFFATVEELGGDGLVPVSTLGIERFYFDDTQNALIGEESGDEYRMGQRLKLRLVEANPISGALKFELADGANHLPTYGRGRRDGSGSKFKKKVVKHRGRPKNIRHQSRKR